MDNFTITQPDLTGLFKAYPERTDSKWLRQVPQDERKVFGQIGYTSLMYLYGFETGYEVFHRAGGKKRAKYAKRNCKGQFKKG